MLDAFASRFFTSLTTRACIYINPSCFASIHIHTLPLSLSLSHFYKLLLIYTLLPLYTLYFIHTHFHHYTLFLIYTLLLTHTHPHINTSKHPYRLIFF